MTLKLTFHGAAGCVTGFCARLETDQAVLLIDCGMFQGPKTLKALNYDPLPFDPHKVDAVLLTHAHIDHSGLLPKLMKAGYEGPIYATAGTRDLCAVMLADAGGIQESEVRQLNRRNERRGRDAVEPIYTAEDAEPTLALFRKVKLGDPVAVAPGVTAIYWEAGHILGAASIELRVDTQDGPVSLLFSGDLGPGGRDYSADPEGPSGVDYLILESTYGDRERTDATPDDRRRQLAEVLNQAQAAGGPLLIPAFAVERSQELLADILTLMRDGQVPDCDVFLDSPLAIEATEVFRQRGWIRSAGRNPFEDLHASEQLKFLRDPWESDTLDRLKGWHIILAASGMCDAGRVRKHLKRLLWNRKATVLLAGYQAVGTLGRILAEGAERVRIQGEDIQVRAAIRTLDVYSGHADARGLAAWAKARGPVRGGVFLAHGEPPGLEGLKARLAGEGFPESRLFIPVMDQTFRLTAKGAEASEGPRRIAAGAAARPDWHNARAALLLALDARLEGLDDAARTALLKQLARSLADTGGASASTPVAPAQASGPVTADSPGSA
ncbi:MBL fold metallo-hydrolase [Phenylobacterium aquaticum]|uniref:MBL fold metallo-hydrolase n=1 Tax=Phenylobacterium aquaticum TaxID=1763816 RepID=UPI001F5D9B26|nr:MBL fold metallo-hydrolase [Phenylobacterium aquaticum]MCI3134155.1 MBL fold metallo-hydrolase [Phenylobacterium aquaticum]